MLAVGKTVAGVLSEKRSELGMSNEIEALLRASIAAATPSINAYIGALPAQEIAGGAELSGSREIAVRSKHQATAAASHAIDRRASPSRQGSRSATHCRVRDAVSQDPRRSFPKAARCRACARRPPLQWGERWPPFSSSPWQKSQRRISNYRGGL